MNLRARNKTITRNLTVIEKRLSKRLETFYNTYIRDSLTPVQIIKEHYDLILRGILHKPIQESYMLAVKQVGDPPISALDIGNIQNIINEQSNNFWKLAEKLKQRQIVVETEEEHKNRIAANLFDALAAFIGQAAQTVFRAFNTGIKSKISQVTNAFDIGDIDEGIPPISGRVKFMTAGDAKVDPVFCEPLDGQEFDATDPDIPEPPLHLHCRCRLVPLLENE